MTPTDRQTWTSIDSAATIAQASGEGRHDQTALENWAYLFFWKKDHAAARAWWQAELAPLFVASPLAGIDWADVRAEQAAQTEQALTGRERGVLLRRQRRDNTQERYGKGRRGY